MDFNLEKDLVFLDLEATGLHVIRDRIVQVGMVKYPADGGATTELNLMVNPGIPISKEASQVHGFSNEDVANEPLFSEIAGRVMEFIGNSDLAGYNLLSYDIPMLLEELYRAGIELEMENRRVVDVQRIFYKMEPRNLAAAYRYYCQKEMDNAHDALADVRATAEILKGQLKMYSGKDLKKDDGEVIEEPVKNDVEALHKFTNDYNLIDATRRLKYDHKGRVVFNFGKYAGKEVGPLLAKDKQYLNWILNKDFSYQVKYLVQKLAKAHEEQQSK
nr:3'-5' exonuclease [Saprospiraceae bacterium]